MGHGLHGAWSKNLYTYTFYLLVNACCGDRYLRTAIFSQACPASLRSCCIDGGWKLKNILF